MEAAPLGDQLSVGPRRFVDPYLTPGAPLLKASQVLTSQERVDVARGQSEVSVYGSHRSSAQVRIIRTG
jgi:hypothetical protein